MGEIGTPLKELDVEDFGYKETWLDKILPESIAHYRASYALLRPWLILEYWLDEIKYAWQRVFRGWDDRITWSLDYYLAEKIPLWLTKLKEDKNGVPMQIIQDGDCVGENHDIPNDILELRQKEYHEILDKIIRGFVAYREMNEVFTKEETEPLQKEFNKGMELFVEWFSSFWD